MKKLIGIKLTCRRNVFGIFLLGVLPLLTEVACAGSWKISGIGKADVVA